MEKIQNHALILGLVLAWITLVLSQGSKSFEQDSGTPCYEQDANGEELINKPRVKKKYSIKIHNNRYLKEVT